MKKWLFYLIVSWRSCLKINLLETYFLMLNFTVCPNLKRFLVFFWLIITFLGWLYWCVENEKRYLFYVLDFLKYLENHLIINFKITLINTLKAKVTVYLVLKIFAIFSKLLITFVGYTYILKKLPLYFTF